MSSRNDGTFGEQSLGFILGAAGYMIIDGPSGAGGKAANAGGLDAIAYHPITKMLIVPDNKDKNEVVVYSAPAIDRNQKNAKGLSKPIKYLDDAITKVKGMTDLPFKPEIVDRLQRLRDYHAGTAPEPPDAMLVVTNAGIVNKVQAVGPGLASRGVKYFDVQNLKPLPNPPRFQQGGHRVSAKSIAQKVKSMRGFTTGSAPKLAHGALLLAPMVLQSFVSGPTFERAVRDKLLEPDIVNAILAAYAVRLGTLVVMDILTTGDGVTSSSILRANLYFGESHVDALHKWETGATIDAGNPITGEVGTLSVWFAPFREPMQ